MMPALWWPLWLSLVGNVALAAALIRKRSVPASVRYVSPLPSCVAIPTAWRRR